MAPLAIIVLLFGSLLILGGIGVVAWRELGTHPERRKVGRVRRANGEQELTTTEACRYKIAAANDDAGRSLTVDRLILDELRRHTSWAAYNAAIPTMNAVADAQAWALSNAGGDEAVVLNSLRDSAVAHLDDGFVVAGFSNGAGMAEHVVTQRRCGGALLFSGALPLAVLGAAAWPADVPVQLHRADGDPMRDEQWDAAFVAEVRRAGAAIEVFSYPVTGHLFTDPSLPEEFDAAATERLWERALAFCARVGAHPSAR